jgi:hypothetical protein
MIPTSRETFIQFCLRRLGHGVVHIEGTPEQWDDCVDLALTKWREYHYEAVQRTYLKHQITSQDLTNMWIPCDDTIMSVVRVLQYNEENLNIFDVRYQLRLQDFYNFSNVSMQHYVITMEKLRLIDWLLNPEPTISFQRLSNRIYLNIDWQHRVCLGQYLVFEVYQWLDETMYPRIWTDLWLQKYATALMRLQWGSNVKKYKGVQTLGGIMLDGQQFYDEAKAEVEELEDILVRDYSPPMRIFIG